jgi:hypothetical protein
LSRDSALWSLMCVCVCVCVCVYVCVCERKSLNILLCARGQTTCVLRVPIKPCGGGDGGGDDDDDVFPYTVV